MCCSVYSTLHDYHSRLNEVDIDAHIILLFCVSEIFDPKVNEDTLISFQTNRTIEQMASVPHGRESAEPLRVPFNGKRVEPPMGLYHLMGKVPRRGSTSDGIVPLDGKSTTEG